MSEHTGEEALDINFVVCALDLITGMAEGLGPSFESLVTGSDIVQLGYQCMQDESPGARQSSYALIGILAKHCLPHIRLVLSTTKYLYSDCQSLFAHVELMAWSDHIWKLSFRFL